MPYMRMANRSAAARNQNTRLVSRTAPPAAPRPRSAGDTLGRRAQSCRQLAARARGKIEPEHPHGRAAVSTAEHREVAEKFIGVCASGDLATLVRTLDPDVTGVIDLGPSDPRTGRTFRGVAPREWPPTSCATWHGPHWCGQPDGRSDECAGFHGSAAVGGLDARSRTASSSNWTVGRSGEDRLPGLPALRRHPVIATSPSSPAQPHH